LARALTWGRAPDALDTDPNAQEMYDQATQAALDRAEDQRLDAAGVEVRELPDLAEAVRQINADLLPG
jgi:hypothetical protein